MNVFTDTFETNFGLFSVAISEAGAVCATAFGNAASLRTRLARDCDFHPDRVKTAQVRAHVLAYCAGEPLEFTLPLAPVGTPFQHRVWTALRAIPLGRTRSYGELAAALGHPGAARAIGRANATNPICLIVPCHRVIGADGSLTGFAFGEEIKRRLLAHERAMASRAECRAVA